MWERRNQQSSRAIGIRLQSQWIDLSTAVRDYLTSSVAPDMSLKTYEQISMKASAHFGPLLLEAWSDRMVSYVRQIRNKRPTEYNNAQQRFNRANDDVEDAHAAEAKSLSTF